MDLKEWAIAFIKHRDLAFRRIASIDDKGKELLVKQKDSKEIHNHVAEKIDDALLKKIHSEDNKMIFCLNTEENLEFLIKHWDKFKIINNLTLVFANLKNDDKWIINPKLHSIIADSASIKQGLQSMYDTANGKVDSGPKKKKPKMFDDDVADEDDSEE
jgi:hypothetical protein